MKETDFSTGHLAPRMPQVKVFNRDRIIYLQARIDALHDAHATAMRHLRQKSYLFDAIFFLLGTVCGILIGQLLQ